MVYWTCKFSLIYFLKCHQYKWLLSLAHIVMFLTLTISVYSVSFKEQQHITVFFLLSQSSVWSTILTSSHCAFVLTCSIGHDEIHNSVPEEKSLFATVNFWVDTYDIKQLANWSAAFRSRLKDSCLSRSAISAVFKSSIASDVQH